MNEDTIKTTPTGITEYSAPPEPSRVTPSGIREYGAAEESIETPVPPQSFFERVRERVKEGVGEFKSAPTFGEAFLATTGAAGGVAGEAFGQLYKPLTPLTQSVSKILKEAETSVIQPFVKSLSPRTRQKITSGTESFLENTGVLKALDTYKQFKETNPEEAARLERNLKNVIETSFLFPAADIARYKAPALAQKTWEITKDVAQKARQGAVHLLEEPVTKSLATKYEAVFNQTKRGFKELGESRKYGKDPAQFLAEKAKGRTEMIPDVVDGKISAGKQIELLNKDIQPLNEAMNKMLAYSPEEVQWEAVLTKAKSNISNLKSPSALTKEQMIAEAEKIIRAESRSGGLGAKLPKLNQFKAQQIHESGVFDATKPKFSSDAQYQLGKAAREIIEQTAKDAPVKELNSYIGSHYDAIDMLRLAEGQIVKGGRLGKYMAWGLGASLGTGVEGRILGAVAGNVVADFIMSTTITNPVKSTVLGFLKQISPEAYTQAIEYIKSAGLEQQLRPLLTSGETIYLPPTIGGKEFVPSKTDISGMGEFRQRIPPTEPPI